ncbi:MAG: YraN family protein [Candidatus Taylorbacteria bacterium]
MKLHDGHNKKVGTQGEDIACVFLMKHGYKIIERNYWRKWGEIDIVTEFDNELHFIEVKAVSRESLDDVTHVTSSYRPEDNVHYQKQKRLSRVFQTYLIDKHRENEEWTFDLVCVYLSDTDQKAGVKIIKDIIL